jgi:hypothetical protein
MDQFSNLSISFDIIPSNHAALTIHWYPVLAVALQPLPKLVGYAINDDGQMAWTKIFIAIPAEPIHDIPSLEQAAATLYQDIDKASSMVFLKWRTPDPCGVHWWSPPCDKAITVV